MGWGWRLENPEPQNGPLDKGVRRDLAFSLLPAVGFRLPDGRKVELTWWGPLLTQPISFRLHTAGYGGGGHPESKVLSEDTEAQCLG